MKIAFLQSGMTGYQDACLRALRARGNEILNIFPTAYENANFDTESFRDYGRALHWPQDKPSAEWVQVAVARAPEELVAMSEGGGGLSKRLNPTLWAGNVTSEVKRPCAAMELPGSPSAGSKPAHRKGAGGAQSRAVRP